MVRGKFVYCVPGAQEVEVPMFAFLRAVVAGITLHSVCKVVLILFVVYVVWRVYALLLAQLHSSGHENIREHIASVPLTGLRVAVIGSGISGIQAMKVCAFVPLAWDDDITIFSLFRT